MDRHHTQRYASSWARAWWEMCRDLEEQVRRRFQRDPSARVIGTQLLDWSVRPGRGVGSVAVATALREAGNDQERPEWPEWVQAELLAHLLRVEHELRQGQHDPERDGGGGVHLSQPPLPFDQREGPGLSFVEAIQRFPGAFWVPAWNRLFPDVMGWIDRDPPLPEFLQADPPGPGPIQRAWEEFERRAEAFLVDAEDRIDHGARVTPDDLERAGRAGLIDPGCRADRLRLLLRLLRFERNARLGSNGEGPLHEAELRRRFPGVEGVALSLNLFRADLAPPYRLIPSQRGTGPGPDRDGRGGMARVIRAEWWSGWPGPPPDGRIDPEVPLALKVAEPGDFENQIETYEGPALTILGNAVATPKLDQGWWWVDPDRPSGRPFLVLPWIEGLDLAELIAAHPRGLNPETARKIFFSAAAQVARAHKFGVIHRDIKPQNIRIRTHATPEQAHEQLPEERDGILEEAVMVMDFGVASHPGRRLLHAETRAFGTPNYVAPEQLDPHQTPGPQADVFSLGVTLHEMLTGQSPFAPLQASHPRGTAASLGEVYRWIRGRRAIPLSQVRPDLPRGLETVLQVCLQPDPRDRYASVAELLADLNRAMNGQRVRARPPGRLTRWARRVQERPGRALAVLGAAAALILALGGALVAFARAEANEQARRNAVRADRAARYTLERILQISLDGTSTDRAERLLVLFQSLAANPEVPEEIQAWAHSHHARLELERGDSAAAAALFEQALALRRRLAQRNPEVRVDLAETLHDLAERRQAAQRYHEAETLYRDALQIRRDLVREDPDDPARRSDLARSLGYLGDLMVLRERWQEAQACYHASLEIREALRRAKPDDPALAFQLARAHRNFARLDLIGPPDLHAVEAASHRATRLTRATQRYERSWTLLQTELDRGSLDAILQRGLNPVQSVSEARDALNSALFLREAAVSLNGRGEARRQLGQRHAAAADHQTALDLLDRIDPARFTARDQLERLRSLVGLASAQDDPHARAATARHALVLADDLLAGVHQPDWTQLDTAQRAGHLLRLRALALSDPRPALLETARREFQRAAPPYDPEWRIQRPFWDALPLPPTEP